VEPVSSAIKVDEKWRQQVPEFLYHGGVGSRFSPKVSNHVRGCKAKAIPLQAWTGPEVSRRLRFQDLKTIAT